MLAAPVRTLSCSEAASHESGETRAAELRGVAARETSENAQETHARLVAGNAAEFVAQPARVLPDESCGKIGSRSPTGPEERTCIPDGRGDTNGTVVRHHSQAGHRG